MRQHRFRHRVRRRYGCRGGSARQSARRPIQRLFQFHLRRSDCRKPVGARSQNARKLHRIRFPAVVDKHSRERRRAADLAQQAVLVRRIASGDLTGDPSLSARTGGCRSAPAGRSCIRRGRRARLPRLARRAVMSSIRKSTSRPLACSIARKLTISASARLVAAGTGAGLAASAMIGLGPACLRSMKMATSRTPATAKEAIAKYEWKALAAGTSVSPISTSKANAQMIETTLIAFIRGFRGE